MNEEESTKGMCDHCGRWIAECECEILCPMCEDFRPRKHRCLEAPRQCEYCGEPMTECQCQPRAFYD